MNFFSNPKKFKKYYKNKSNQVNLFSTLKFGTYGLQSKLKTDFTIEQFNLILKLLKKNLKGQNKKNTFWLRSFPDTIITKKPKEIRMGRGKGNNLFKIAVLNKGSIFLEMKNLNVFFEYYLLNIIKNKFFFLNYYLINDKNRSNS